MHNYCERQKIGEKKIQIPLKNDNKMHQKDGPRCWKEILRWKKKFRVKEEGFSKAEWTNMYKPKSEVSMHDIHNFHDAWQINLYHLYHDSLTFIIFSHIINATCLINFHDVFGIINLWNRCVKVIQENRKVLILNSRIYPRRTKDRSLYHQWSILHFQKAKNA